MHGLLADINAEGHLHAIISVCQNAGWGEIWRDLAVPVYYFAALGLDREMSDEDLWHFCQRRGLLLLTGNRNRTSADSLEATITAHNHADSVPVLTLADPDRVIRDRAYVEAVGIKLIDILMDIDTRFGTGRLWLP